MNAEFIGGGFSNCLLRSLLQKPENIHYIEALFGDALNKIYNYGVLPQDKKYKILNLLKTYSTTNSESLDQENPVEEEEELKVPEIMPFNDLIQFCDEALDSIMSQLNCMPTPTRYLLKLIEKQAKKRVINIYIILIVISLLILCLLKRRLKELLLISYFNNGGIQFLFLQSNSD